MEQKILEKLDEIGRESADRRGFLKKAGQVAATVPAVALLLSAQTTPAEAHGRYGGGKGRGKGRGRGHRRGGFKTTSRGASALRGAPRRRARHS